MDDSRDGNDAAREERRRELEGNAKELAIRAVNFDQTGQLEAAIYYYREASSVLMIACKEYDSQPMFLKKVKDYLDRADTLEAQWKEQQDAARRPKPTSEALDLSRARFLLMQALELDEAGGIDEPLQQYEEAIELCLFAKSMTVDKDLQQRLFHVASQALERAKTLRERKRELEASTAPSAPPSPGPPPPPIYPLLPVINQVRRPPVSSESTESNRYTPWELEVLAKTSIINHREYVPFLGADARDRFALILPFEDKDGLLGLSPKQRAQFAEWVRPSELVSEPTLIESTVDPFSIKQTCVTDCSFVSSITVCALYEKKFKKRLITGVIYPKNSRGEPVFNPCGKYTVKLYFNGVHRKVTLDDRLPLGKHNQLLCSYSNKKKEFWVSLLEKAYLKVMGGYDFPGSNSNIDLHALTGWIPDREPIRTKEACFDSEALFRKLLDRHEKGDVLVTLATGPLRPELEERTGLADCHAYAVLDIRFVHGKRLFLLKNPWSHMRWKGRFSDRDLRSWTPEISETLHYNPRNAQQFDNGVFWIDYESILGVFDVFYLNWRPTLFQYTSCTHDMWHGGSGPAKDLYNIGDNPQYLLSVSSTGAAVWVLLTRHIVDRDDFASNKEYIALLVYKGGDKVYLPHDPPPMIDGARINSPHYLVKILVQPDSETHYTLVVSQYEKTTTIYYTIRAYSTVPFMLKKLQNPYRFTKEDKKGSWGPATAGGCMNHLLTYNKNPTYRFDIQSPHDHNQILITLKGPRQYHLGFDVEAFALDRMPLSAFPRCSSGVFRQGYTVLELKNVPAGKYNLVPCTHQPGQEGPFFLSVSCDHQLELHRVQN
ncbi:calpain-7-like isoform X1 [Varroa destructor]|uniref:Calpain catalytic domain-containing protein n=2 Tax=Varroa destructor TaxID=109461 RepID=A0A7M7KD35_VARDE|nr:calpain-7-like isoform X1 [Varroa destructor]XP_022665045.1 calpain-7-like isoform X1 [Varroa destructor]XP_022665046.1 calpain-7-like isoform X1 [Varroa destructor]XP_022665047.1 calpain-7-like isoform X1 [Varroa destructor]XP_022665048.1 calpain-7-like isoform X1 [Varroa destructor]